MNAAEKTLCLYSTRHLSIATHRALYSAARKEVCKRDKISLAEFNADMEDNNLMAAGYNRHEAMTLKAVEDYLGGFTSYHCHVSPETLEWSSMEETRFSTTERHPAALKALCRLARV